MNLNTDAMVDFLVRLLNTHSPTGYAVDAIALCRNEFAQFGGTMEVTRKGALMITLPGEATDAPRGITAHVDTLGLMVKEIKRDGRLKCTNIAGVVWPGIENEGVTVRTFDGTLIRGSLVPVNASIHVNRDVRKAERNAESMEIRLDERTSSEKETRALGVAEGDFVFIDPRVETGEAGFIRSRFLDDKASVAAIYGALLALEGAKPAQMTHILISNYEEVGHGGAADWPADLAELVTVDMAAMGNGQNSDEFSVTICVKDTSGPYHHGLTSKLRTLADEHGIDAKADIYPYYASDGTAYWNAGGRAAVALIGPGVDSSHSYERTHRDALDATAHLIGRYLLAQ